MISRDDWLNALAEIQPVTDDSALTSAEIAELFGTRETATRGLIRKLLQSGRATVARKTIIDNSGRRQIVPAYRLAASAKPKKPK